MSQQDANISLVKGFIDEIVNGGNVDALGKYFADNVLWSGGSLGERRGLEANIAFMKENAVGAFTGMHLEIKEIYPAGDSVVVFFTNSGTHSGDFLGSPATGKHAVWNGVGIYKIADGKIADARFVEDILAMLLQLGITHLPQV
ncbi:ester cyclase [Streptomyces sp. NPDC059568]|uniref:ester cyclase n=1 Tax=unclassified Streptomyces TaxID=2593676 RepID=UPI0036C0BFBA